MLLLSSYQSSVVFQNVSAVGVFMGRFFRKIIEASVVDYVISITCLISLFSLDYHQFSVVV